VVVVEGAPPATAVTGAITMLIVGFIFTVVGIGVFCSALFTLAVHAFPHFVGLTAGICSFQIGMVRSEPSPLVSSLLVLHSCSRRAPGMT
jgi:hypothetical protein